MRSWPFVIVPFLTLVGSLGGCDDRCPAGNPGTSDIDFEVGNGGTAAGVWWLTLSPSVSTSTCADGREILPQTYAYTVEFRQASDGSGARTRLFVDGYLFVEDGEYSDGADILTYETPEREDGDRDGGAITYKINGNAALSDEGGVLEWTGSETIRVLSSEDPNVREGCIFEYDIVGEKVCDE